MKWGTKREMKEEIDRTVEVGNASLWHENIYKTFVQM